MDDNESGLDQELNERLNAFSFRGYGNRFCQRNGSWCKADRLRGRRIGLCDDDSGRKLRRLEQKQKGVLVKILSLGLFVKDHNFILDLRLVTPSPVGEWPLCAAGVIAKAWDCCKREYWMLHHATRKIGYQEPAVAYGVYRGIAKASCVNTKRKEEEAEIEGIYRRSARDVWG